LGTITLGDPRNQCRISHSRRIDADLVGTSIEYIASLVQRANSATHREGNKDSSRCLADRFQQRCPVLMGCRNVEQNDLIGPGFAVSRREFRRIAGIFQIDELDTLDYTSTLNVETGDHALGQCHRLQKFSRIFRPTGPDFSGWNCTPNNWARSTTAEKAPPYSHSATVPSTIGAR
jgi:hypothetical protein